MKVRLVPSKGTWVSAYTVTVYGLKADAERRPLSSRSFPASGPAEHAESVTLNEEKDFAWDGYELEFVTKAWVTYSKAFFFSKAE